MYMIPNNAMGLSTYIGFSIKFLYYKEVNALYGPVAIGLP